MNMNKNYETPFLEVLETAVESGFAQSGGNVWRDPYLPDEDGYWNDNGTI